MAFVNERREDGKWQTVDHKRNIILRQNGRSGTVGPYKFVLSYDSQDINFEAALRTGPLVNKLFEVHWDITFLYIPADFSERKENILSAIKESLDEYGSCASRKHVSNVTVNFLAPRV